MRIILVFLSLSLVSLTADAQLSFFEGTYEEAVERASEEKKLLFLDFYAEWCMPCLQLERYGFKDPDFMAMIQEHFIAYKVDVDMFVGMDVAEQYKVKVYPTLIVSDTKGREKNRSTGYQTADQLKDLVKAYAK